MYNFCTLFDSNYFSRGITLYDSLEKSGIDFHLYIFAFDDACYNNLLRLNLKYSTIISLHDLEDEELLRVKPTRTKAEYCWTCTSTTVLYCINNYKLDNCTYVDADIYFYNSPKVLFEEIGSASIALTEHNYTKKYDQSKTSGKYCVQFVYFKNDQTSIEALTWWRDSCIDWCYSRLENGKFGDQKYLDDWTTRYKNVHVIENVGAGVALWNIQQFELINRSDNKLLLNFRKTGKEIDVIFYHFHGLKYLVKENYVEILPTKLSITKEMLNVIYIPYIKSLIGIDLEDSGKFDYSEFKFRSLSLFIRAYLPLHFFLKKNKILQALKGIFVKSIK